ncbi:GNAT family N-acetyltransferase [Streptomyces sp. NA04227]|uniref:GNAT family N-acetyltransferase n=1 Tax=Streptomyces sp. NA04227 TaxID=2742136 RepID=UPI0015904769|nr:GNAT family N-acetyltransferase [Streptomyces sp. NA04227]QKW08761.1 GNAT family N-acetyltransferase [Streptomyces sp. NA04227]
MRDEASVVPVTTSQWSDVEELLGRRGAVKGCWCMFFRLTPQERKTQWGEGNRQALRELVAAGREPGLVAYREGSPAGWVSVAPREEFCRLDRSPVSKPVDDRPVWALVCLYVAREHRGRGVARELVRGAVDFAAARGAKTVEAYPVDDTLGTVTADEAFHGVVSLLADEGFQEVARRTPKRPVMRREIG